MILKIDEDGFRDGGCGYIHIVWLGRDSEGSTVHTCTDVLILLYVLWVLQVA